MSQPPRKKARRVHDSIQRAEYSVTRHARVGTRVVERDIGRTAGIAPVGPHVPRSNVEGAAGPSWDHSDDVPDPAGMSDDRFEFIPTLDEIRSRWGKVCVKTCLMSSAHGFKNQNSFLQEFLARRAMYLDRILDAEGLPMDVECSVCHGPGIWWCKDCLGQPLYCRGHCREVHQKHPFHRIQRWTGRYFAERSMWEVGVHLFLGHNGNCCPKVNVQKLAADELDLDQLDENAAAAEDHPQAEHIPYLPRVAEQQPWLHEDNMDGEEDNLMWEDISDSSAPFGRAPPKTDEQDNHFLLIVDASQLLSLPVVYCACEVISDADMQFLDLQFFPASFKEIKTVFTFRCLDDFRLSNLECKTSAYQYFQRLRRLTNPAFPNSAPNRYAELRRVSRQWRNLKLRKWFGFGHRTETPSRGQMALFCAACPQTAVNLPSDWQEKYTE